MARPNPGLAGDRIQASKEDQIKDSVLVLVEARVNNGLSHGRTVKNVLFSEINLLRADGLLGKGGEEGVQAPYETNTRCGGNDMNHV